MKEDIKEILNKLSNRKQETLIQGLRECQLKDIEHPFITREEYIDKILDYITNLQQDIENYVKITLHDRKEIERLQQENEFLKLNNPEQNIEHFRIVKENKRKIDNLRKENEKLKFENGNLKTNEKINIEVHNKQLEIIKDYKSRCEKAIEYIKMCKCDYSPYELTDSETRIILNILNGSDEK